ncbi:hypothetical protein EW146_g2934 [Bondarzewia mesenterica]|uniref:Calcipressin n=1 Tax=Bondarzewia mesenterica TaxID=1095465 RepID=A0A4S4LZB4_9AGAM|nr:hypothetical protein EW146_g2934 [Bondarzewia mesenterica]
MSSSPTSQSPPHSSTPQLTNTLVITSLPPPLFHPFVLEALRDHFATYGELHAWAPIRAFARIILVYREATDAEMAKTHCDGLVIEATSETAEFTLRVYRGDPTPITDAPTHGFDPKYLRPPAIEKNFLISPPGSPPVGWEPIQEEPPNSAPLADDIMAALRKLQLAERAHHGGGSNIEVLVHPEDGAGIGVYVESCDDEDEVSVEGDWEYGEDNPSRMQWKPAPTALPPHVPWVGA